MFLYWGHNLAAHQVNNIETKTSLLLKQVQRIATASKDIHSWESHIDTKFQFF